MFCKKCGNELASTSKFCGKCGTPRPESESTTSVADEVAALHACPSCGAACKPDAKFCGKCGHSFSGHGVETAPAVSMTSAPLTATVRPPVEDPVSPQTKATPANNHVRSTAKQRADKSKAGLYIAASCGVVALAVGAWWLTSHRSEPVAAPSPAGSAPQASVSTASVPAQPASVPPSVPAVDPGPPASEPTPVSQEAGQPSSAPVIATPPPVGNPQPAEVVATKRRQAEAQRPRDSDRAKLQKANKTLDDLLK